MSIEVSPEIEARLKATAEAEGLSVDAYLEHLLNEREELLGLSEKAVASIPQAPDEELRAKIEKGFSQSDLAEVADGEAFCSGLLTELDDIDRKRRAG